MKISNVETFQGMYVALYSAYDEAGAVSPVRAAKLARYYVGKGLAGLYVGGSSGEGILQSVEERKAMLEAVLQEVRGELKIIVHVGANATADSVELSRHAEACGADAISAVPSIYYRLSEAAVENHWQQMIDAASLPFIIYNIPQTTGFSLSPPYAPSWPSRTRSSASRCPGKAPTACSSSKLRAGKTSSSSTVPTSSFWRDG